MKKVLVLFLAFLGAIPLLHGQSSIKGRVINGESKEALPNVLVRSGQHSSLTNSVGEFELLLPKGEHKIEFSHVGFTNKSLTVLVSEKTAFLEIMLEPKNEYLDAVTVSDFFAKPNSPIAFTNVRKKDISDVNLGQDIPVLLDQTVSAVSSSDAGAGIGYTNIRIRGTDQTRINVTINGIPYNDPESQGVFWVNLPDISSSTQSLQIQRGVGSSSNGSAAFGATINLLTSGYESKPYAELNLGGGSYNTYKRNVLFGTGIINEHWIIEGRLSAINSDGYIDRANSSLSSYYFSAGYLGEKSSLKFIHFAGKELTYQSWWGTPQSRIENDSAGMYWHVVNNGLDSEDSLNLFNSGRTYNYYTYENEVDNYAQNHYQLHWHNQLNSKLKYKLALHYTYGRGYYEQFRKQDDFSDYGLTNPVMPSGDTIYESDFIRQRWLDNHFVGGVYALEYQHSAWNFTFGGGYNEYYGDHFGEIIWAEYAQNIPAITRYYNNAGVKKDLNNYLKADVVLGKWHFFGDVQLRNVQYRASGVDNDQVHFDIDRHFLFFNPKAGMHYTIDQKQSAYASYGVGNKEPVRSDFIDAPEGVTPQHETLFDLEAGYRYQHSKMSWELNLYHMKYNNQLVVTGELNDVGAAVRQNIPDSYRAGIEIQGAFKLSKSLLLSANATLSQNKIAEFEETIYDYTNDFDIVVISHKNTDIALSPNIVAGGSLQYQPTKNWSITWVSKFVGQQFLDNTSNQDRIIPAFMVNHLLVGYSIKLPKVGEVQVRLMVNNLMNVEYQSFGYTYSYIYGDLITENFYYPQALRNFMLQLSVRL